jgi:hypothetical protein
VEWREAAVTLEYLLGHDEYAADLSRRLLEVDPESALGHRMLGVQELNRGNIGAAQQRFADAVRDQPDDDLLADQARHARALTQNPLWWPTLLSMRPGGMLLGWCGAIAVAVGAAAVGGGTLAGLVVFAWVVIWIWGLVAPAVLRWPGRV